MEFTFQSAKNNEKTVLVNNLFLHSNYNPSKEAERFVESINISYIPENIFIIEPGLSYCASFLKQRFPDTKLCVIRLSDKFNEYNSAYDKVYNFYNGKDYFTKQISADFNEEQLLKSYFVTWKNSENIFKEDVISISETVSELLNTAKTQLVTRQYFEKKWLVNSIKYLINSNNFVTLNGNINKPVLVISSGPSLEDGIEIIKHYRSHLFIICLSSAISVCNFYNIIPDLYMSTDGGFWAGEHLKHINSSIPLAIPMEAYGNTTLFTNQLILPLYYKDSIVADFLTPYKNLFTEAARNGTVTGTALIFALQNTQLPVFLIGTDMSSQKGFQHTQPNELELNNSINDFMLASKEKRSVSSQFNSGSLDIYKQWFQNLNLQNRIVYRIIENNKKQNNLGMIKDINIETFTSLIQKTPSEKNAFNFVKTSCTINTLEFRSYINNIFSSEHINNQLFPLDMVSLSHNPDNEDLKNKINERKEKLWIKIRKLLND